MTRFDFFVQSRIISINRFCYWKNDDTFYCTYLLIYSNNHDKIYYHYLSIFYRFNPSKALKTAQQLLTYLHYESSALRHHHRLTRCAWSYCKNFFFWSAHNLFSLHLDLFPISIKPLRTVLAFLSFKGLTQTYLVKTSMTHNKYLATEF